MKDIINYTIPKYIKELVGKLEGAGYEAFVVGGSVRDLLLDKEASDYDLTTDARPEEIMGLFTGYKTILTGLEFGTVVLVVDKNNIEITTYRIEEEYRDGRRPSRVNFTKNLDKDLSRRDFTINAMAYNEKTGIVDPFNGRQDIKGKTIRTVGSASERFKEDHLRILRAVRFASQLDFTLEDETYRACKDMSHLLVNISPERIRDEFFKILLSKKPSKGINLMRDLGILETILPELVPMIGYDQKNPYHDKDLYNHTMCVLDKTCPILEIRLSALFHDIGKPQTFSLDEEGVGHFYGHQKVGEEMLEGILRRLHCSNELTDIVKKFVREHMAYLEDMGDKGLKRLISKVGEENIFNLLDLQRADRLCTNSQAKIDIFLERVEDIKRILADKEAYEKKQLDINGNDIIELGYEEGKIIGEILDYLMEEVLERPDLNRKDLLIEEVKIKFR